MSQPLTSASQIFDAEDLVHEDVEVPEWHLTLRIQQMDAQETVRFTRSMDTHEGAANGMYLILVACTRTMEGTLVFTYSTPEELTATVAALQRKNINVLQRLQRVALRVNAMTIEGKADLKKD